MEIMMSRTSVFYGFLYKLIVNGEEVINLYFAKM